MAGDVVAIERLVAALGGRAELLLDPVVARTDVPAAGAAGASAALWPPTSAATSNDSGDADLFAADAFSAMPESQSGYVHWAMEP